MDSGGAEPLLKKRMENGALTEEQPALSAIQAHAVASLERFDATYKRLLNPHLYKVSITSKLRALKLELIEKHFGNE